MRRAKVVCTLGPATSSEECIKDLAIAGMNVARLNFSHGSDEEHHARVKAIRSVSNGLDRPLAILQDLPGPKIRIGNVKGGRMDLEPGSKINVRVSPDEGTSECLTTEYVHLLAEVKVNDSILIDDGSIELKVLVVSDQVECEVIRGGSLTGRKGFNFPDAGSHAPALTERDRNAVQFGVANQVDYMALSFVRSAADVSALKGLIASLDAEIPVVAKLEKPQAIRNLDAILSVADAVMVARGDLGVEMSPADVPVLQKRILRKARHVGVPTIVATQMLESMTHSARPTRAEASDVANAIFDGADALMLSGETAVGEYPVETVEMMSQIIEVAEREPNASPYSAGPIDSVPEAVCTAASQVANELKAKYLVAFTESGNTPRLLSQARPRVPILAFTSHENVYRRLVLFWGVTPMQLARLQNTDAMIAAVDKHLLERKLVQPGEILVIICGAPVGMRNSTNLMKVHRTAQADLG